MKLSDLDYELPKELIAQSPTYPRDYCRLMVVERKTGEINHKHFYDLPEFLGPNDVLVFNKTKVFPARIYGSKEILLLRNIDNFSWEIMIRGKSKIGDQIVFPGFKCEIIDRNEKIATVRFDIKYLDLLRKLEKIGKTPLPPYIHSTEKEEKLRREYNTVYAEKMGSAAAPTAGLHFTKRLMDKLKKKGVQIEFVTLHVGLGTFEPVKEEKLEEHKIHEEYYDVDKNTYQRIIDAKKSGKRIIAVGTTSVRVLESFPKITGYTKLFIYPPYSFRLTDGLITNFHLPKSTLLALVFAFSGSDLIKKAYKEAVKEKYKFFSFGDAMLLV